MVGIGGGAPSPKHDIRLGDVVVSSPAGRTDGVIHYEFGKTIQNQKLERTGALNRLPAILLTALSMVGARHECKDHRIVKSVNGMIEWNQRLQKIAHPTKSTETILFLNEQPGQRPSYDTSISS